MTSLILGLPIFGVAFIVVMGGYLLATATGDANVALVLAWVGGGLLLLLLADALLLLGCLGALLLVEEDQKNGDDHLPDSLD